MNDFLKKDGDLIWHPFTPLSEATPPIMITSGKGVYLYTDTGKQIIDAISSWWVNLHGHSNPIISEALAKQANVLEHVIFAGFTHAPAIRLAENLLKILPANQSKVFFSDNGSTAVEVALKMAIQFWSNKDQKKKRIVALEGAYHGDTFGAMSVGGRGMFTDPFANHMFDVDYIAFPSRDNEKLALRKFEEIVATKDVAAFIFEPLLQGAAGMRTYSPQALNQLIRVAQAHDVVCIADEVMTGFGRTGRMFACDYLEVRPDIVAISKGITGGTMPLGVTSCSDKILEAFVSDNFSKTFFHGHSYTANPLACAVANASFEILISDECQQQIRNISQWNRTFVESLSGHAKVRDSRSLGTMMALEVNTEGATSYTNELRKKIYPYFLERGILLRPLGNTLYILPPYVITKVEIDRIYSAIMEFLDVA